MSGSIFSSFACRPASLPAGTGACVRGCDSERGAGARQVPPVTFA